MVPTIALATPVCANNNMKLAAAYTLSSCVSKPGSSNILPKIFDMNVHKKVAEAVAKAARESGTARI